MVVLNFLFLFITIGVTIILLGKIKLMDSSLNRERLKSELILCEKLELDKQIANYKKDMDIIKSKNATLEDLYKAANIKLDIQEKELQRLTRRKN
jgi:hypothetical protein